MKRRACAVAAMGVLAMVLVLMPAVSSATESGSVHASAPPAFDTRTGDQPEPDDVERDEVGDDAGGSPEIIPKPNSGREPVSSGDRGGAAQLAVFGALVVGLATIVALAVRSARRA